MMHLEEHWQWFLLQDLGVQSLIVIGILNVIAAGAKALGLPQIANFCEKLEEAITAMLAAAKQTTFKAIKSFKSPDVKK